MSELMLDTIIGAAIAAVEREGSLRGLSFRAVAREVGCSHVNLYHYVESLDALIWLVYSRALIEFKEACDRRIAARAKGETMLQAYGAGMLSFARDHEGLYRVLWFERIRGAPPPEVAQLIGRVSREFEELGVRGLAELGCSSELAAKAEMFFSLLHGRIAILLNGRSLQPAEDEAKAILAMADRLVASFAQEG